MAGRAGTLICAFGAGRIGDRTTVSIVQAKVAQKPVDQDHGNRRRGGAQLPAPAALAPTTARGHRG